MKKNSFYEVEERLENRIKEIQEGLGLLFISIILLCFSFFGLYYFPESSYDFDFTIKYHLVISGTLYILSGISGLFSLGIAIAKIFEL